MALQYPILSGLFALLPLSTLMAAQIEEIQEVQGQEDTAGQKASIDDAISSFKNRMNEWRKAYGKAKTPAAKKKLIGKYPRPVAEREKIMKLVLANPRTEASVKGLIWVTRNQATVAQLDKALSLLEEYHIEHSGLDRVCSSLSYQFTKSAESFLDAVYRKNPKHKIKGLALYSRAKGLLYRVRIAKLIKDDRKAKEMLTKNYGQACMAMLERCNVPVLEDEAGKHLEEVVKNYTKLPYRRGTLAEQAQRDLFELRNLSIGNLAPDIEGEDIDAIKFKLSDYRGKIVLLDFWGNW